MDSLLSFSSIMEYEEIRNLPDNEFFDLAKSQCEKFPNLLFMLTEEEIIHSFYEYYKKNRVIK